MNSKKHANIIIIVILKLLLCCFNFANKWTNN